MTEPVYDQIGREAAVEVGRRLKIARQLAGLTVQAVGDLGIPGCSTSMISHFEKGERKLSVSKLAVLASLYGLPLSWFVDTNPVALWKAESSPDHVPLSGVWLAGTTAAAK